ncbi:MAG: MogA/MoaB family molybdenum cofactor biosynthesis protein [Dehalococcoidia bacterium]|nr:MogA/MoaB family molybdenum cofactor biosynthesis protein [Dehalococcoidia bacterium]MDZ4247282.1 MogA/MoaB family molybdenum cofactor biosynthesis protein [Dehalococcoidia bacterium]
MFNIGVLTVSDKGARGERTDESGPAIREILESIGGKMIEYAVVPDERIIISATLSRWADTGNLDIILTSGGTGLSPRDFTPEATLFIVDRLVPGLPEAIRAESFKKSPAGILSRGVAGIRKSCLIINLPGSVKAVRECLDIILPALPHALEVLKGDATECATRPDIHNLNKGDGC